MSSPLPRLKLGRVLAVSVLATLLGGAVATPVLAEDHDRGRHVVVRDRGHERRVHDWRSHGRVYYGDGVYVAPPPAVVYGPPPPPPGLNLMFSFGR